eukprot:753048-Hanusia_phi.AAC.3
MACPHEAMVVVLDGYGVEQKYEFDALENKPEGKFKQGRARMPAATAALPCSCCPMLVVWGGHVKHVRNV